MATLWLRLTVKNKMNQTRINIACGNSYIDSWHNFDYVPYSPAVRKANLLDRLPVSDSEADVVYSSHFMEHVPRTLVNSFLSECFRITKSGGHLRLVLPDLEELCRTYLVERERGEHEKADFLVLEMIDQCVRMESGGELGAYYTHLQASPGLHEDMIEFVRHRSGHLIQHAPTTLVGPQWYRRLRNPARIMAKLEWWYCRAILSLLPSVFRQQNVSLTTIGERHAWIYDFHSIETLLRKVGFVDVQRMTATTSRIPNFPFYPLDITEDAQSRKGAESMYIEAIRP